MEQRDVEYGVSTPASRPRVLDLLDLARHENRPLHIAAPMVRKLPFRLLARTYAIDIVYTPMLLAHEFLRSAFARDSDFTTHPFELQTTPDGRPHVLIAQFAATGAEEFARAAELIGPWVDGVDLNCGCPQGWAIKEGIGCALMGNGERVADMVEAAKKALGTGKSVSVKIRVHKDLNETIRLVHLLEEAGVDYITVHGRTAKQRSSTPPDYAAIRTLKASTSVPIFANGDAYSLPDVHRIASLAGADGVMAARGLLENPAMFAGYETTPPECVLAFMEWAVRCPIPFALILHHVGEMTARMSGMGKRERRVLMECGDLMDLVDFVDRKWGRPPVF